jgi:hypothetical protein
MKGLDEVVSVDLSVVSQRGSRSRSMGMGDGRRRTEDLRLWRGKDGRVGRVRDD